MGQNMSYASPSSNTDTLQAQTLFTSLSDLAQVRLETQIIAEMALKGNTFASINAGLKDWKWRRMREMNVPENTKNRLFLEVLKTTPTENGSEIEVTLREKAGEVRNYKIIATCPTSEDGSLDLGNIKIRMEEIEKKQEIKNKWKTPLFDLETSKKLYEKFYAEEVDWRHDKQEVFKTNRWRLMASLAYHYEVMPEEKKEDLIEDLIAIRERIYQHTDRKAPERELLKKWELQGIEKGRRYLNSQHFPAMEVLDEINEIRSNFGNFVLFSPKYREIEKENGTEGQIDDVFRVDI